MFDHSTNKYFAVLMYNNVQPGYSVYINPSVDKWNIVKHFCTDEPVSLDLGVTQTDFIVSNE